MTPSSVHMITLTDAIKEEIVDVFVSNVAYVSEDKKDPDRCWLYFTGGTYLNIIGSRSHISELIRLKLQEQLKKSL